jgi:hypothetical protein
MLFPGPCLLGIYRRVKTTLGFSAFADVETGVIYSNQYDFTTGSAHFTFAGGVVTTTGVPSTYPRDVKKYRLMYASSTGILNAASLTDQGMLVVGQMAQPFTPVDLSSVTVDVTVAPDTARGWAQGYNWVTEYVTKGQWGPTFDNILAMSPTAEQWRAKDGFYFPLRFGSGLFTWQDGGVTVNSFDYPWIYNNAVPTSWNPNLCPPCPPNGNSNIGAASFRGLASSTSLSLTARFGYEVMVEPSSVLRAFVTPSCAPDMGMVEQYFKISSQLADVYPAKYNEDDLLGTIINGIGGIASAVSVMPGTIGTIGKIVAPIAGVLGGMFGKKKSTPAPAPPAPQRATKSMAAPPQGRAAMTPGALTTARRRAGPMRRAGPRPGAGRLVARGRRR